MKIITGRTGEPHIMPEHDALWHRGLVGTESVVLDDQTTENFAAEIATNNEVKIRSGIGMIQGRFYGIEINTYDSLTIENGTQGYKRIDLVVLRYTSNAETRTQEAELVVIKGTPSADTPVVPAHTEGSIDAGDAIADMPLYQINIDGINITGITQVFDLAITLEDCRISPETVQMFVDLGFDPTADYSGGGY